MACQQEYIYPASEAHVVGMNAGVVVNGASCDVDGRIMSTLSTYSGCTLEGGTYGVRGLCVAANCVCAEVSVIKTSS